MAKQHPENKDDDPLELAIDRLQKMPVPEMPQLSKQYLQMQTPHPKRWPLLAASLGAIAASVLIAVFVFQSDRVEDESRSAPKMIVDWKPEIIEIALPNQNATLDIYIAELNEIEDELVGLKRKAKLLDARRKAEQLALRYATAKLNNNTFKTTQPK